MFNEIWCTSLLYWLLSLIIIFPPEEAVSAGITVEALLIFWLGSETESFVHYQIKRTAATIITHCLLIPGYVLTLWQFHPWIIDYMNHNYYSSCSTSLIIASMMPCLTVLFIILNWSKNNWRNHPFAKNIASYSSRNTSLNSLTTNINREFVSIEKFSSQLNSVSRIIATDNWLIKISSYKVNIVSLQDAVVVIESSQDTSIIRDTSSPTQFLTLNTISLRRGVQPFKFRISSIQWQELELKLVNPVVNTNQIVIHKSLADIFSATFEETVQENPTINTEFDRDLCIGCMSMQANIQLVRRCKDNDPTSECTACSCRPMWCLPCLSKWFAARQDQSKPDTWLSSRAPCPTCRSKFCLLDVCLINS